MYSKFSTVAAVPRKAEMIPPMSRPESTLDHFVRVDADLLVGGGHVHPEATLPDALLGVRPVDELGRAVVVVGDVRRDVITDLVTRPKTTSSEIIAIMIAQ